MQEITSLSLIDTNMSLEVENPLDEMVKRAKSLFGEIEAKTMEMKFPETREEVIEFNQKLYPLLSENQLESSLVTTALMMKKAKEKNVPIVSWWSGKDTATPTMLKLAAEMANLSTDDYSIFVVDTPFITDETRETYRNAARAGLPIVRVATLPTLEEINTLYPGWESESNKFHNMVLRMTGTDDVETANKVIANEVLITKGDEVLAMFGSGIRESDFDKMAEKLPKYEKAWRFPRTGFGKIGWSEIMERYKELPTTRVMAVMRQLGGNNNALVLRGVRIASNGDKYEGRPMIDRSPDRFKQTYVYPVSMLNRDEINTLKAAGTDLGLNGPKNYTDPSRAREEWIVDDGEGWKLAPPETVGVKKQYILRYPSGVIVSTGQDKISCAHDLQFPVDRNLTSRDIV